MTVRGKQLALESGLMRSLVLVLLVGCAYKPGSFTYESRTFPGQRVSLGCLDVSVDRRADINGDPVLDYQFGNRCDSPVTIDLVNLPVIGRMASGGERLLKAFDPGLEMHVAKLDALQAGGEAIAYVTDDPGSTDPIVQVCVDVARLERTNKPREAQWLCFGEKKKDLLAEASR